MNKEQNSNNAQNQQLNIAGVSHSELEINEFIDWAFQNIITKEQFRTRLLDLIEILNNIPKSNSNDNLHPIFKQIISNQLLINNSR